jgi:bacterioferritin-associated ferredoxin
MIVCHCHVVSDKTIRAEIESGACTVGDLARRCGAGTCCGGCRPTIGALLAVTRRSRRPSPHNLRPSSARVH